MLLLIKIYPKIGIEENVLVATLKDPVATCGDWRQDWTTLVQS
jgi:hypothetical protein